jgi:hypothetical protein
MFHFNFKFSLPDGDKNNNSNSSSNDTDNPNPSPDFFQGKYDLAAYLNLNNASNNNNGNAAHFKQYRNAKSKPAPLAPPKSNNSQLGHYFVKDQSKGNSKPTVDPTDDDYYYVGAGGNLQKLNTLKPLTNNNQNEIAWKINSMRQKNNSNLSSHHFKQQPQQQPPPNHNINSDLGYYTDYYSQQANKSNLSRLRKSNNHTSSEVYPEQQRHLNKGGHPSQPLQQQSSGETRHYGSKRVVAESRASDRSSENLSATANNFYANYFNNNSQPQQQQPPPTYPGLVKRNSMLSNNSTGLKKTNAITEATILNESSSSGEERYAVGKTTQLPSLNPNAKGKRGSENGTLPGLAKQNAAKINTSNNNNNIVSNVSYLQHQSAAMGYINMLGSPNTIPKYYTETVKLKQVEKKYSEKSGGGGVRKNGEPGYNPSKNYFGNSNGNRQPPNANISSTAQRFQEYKNVIILNFLICFKFCDN